jgi:hypothetical protein
MFAMILNSLLTKQRRGDIISAFRTLDRVALARSLKSVWSATTLPTFIAATRLVAMSTTAPDRLCSNLVTAVVSCGDSVSPDLLNATADVLKEAVDVYGFAAVSRPVRVYVNTTRSLSVHGSSSVAALRTLVQT